MIASGEKKEEYREVKPYWTLRLLTLEDDENPEDLEAYSYKSFDVVRFKNGYARNAPVMDVECLGIAIDDTGNPTWGYEKECFIIKLGKILNP